MKVTDRNAMLELQGDLVLVVVEKEEFIFTIVRFMDGKNDTLELVNRSKNNWQCFPLTQAVFDNMQPVKHKVAKWKLVL